MYKLFYFCINSYLIQAIILFRYITMVYNSLPIPELQLI